MEPTITTDPVAIHLQQVDPAVSRTKFEREVSAFRKIEHLNKERGVLMFSAEFPFVVLGFTAYRIRPLAFVFAVKLDFTNYDLEPPSLKFIDPLTESPLRIEQLNSLMPRLVDPQIPVGPGGQPAPSTNLIAAHPPHNIPFLCLPGIAEYHRHPHHSNDPWSAHRGSSEGTLGFIIDQLHKYGTEPLNGVQPKTIQAIIAGSGMQILYQGFNFSYQQIPG